MRRDLGFRVNKAACCPGIPGCAFETGAIAAEAGLPAEHRLNLPARETPPLSTAGKRIVVPARRAELAVMRSAAMGARQGVEPYVIVSAGQRLFMVRGGVEPPTNPPARPGCYVTTLEQSRRSGRQPDKPAGQPHVGGRVAVG